MKRKSDYRPGHQLVLRIKPELRKAMEQEAAEADRTLSGMVQHVLASWVRERQGQQSCYREPMREPA
jgi:hypothetical protein